LLLAFQHGLAEATIAEMVFAIQTNHAAHAQKTAALAAVRARDVQSLIAGICAQTTDAIHAHATVIQKAHLILGEIWALHLIAMHVIAEI